MRSRQSVVQRSRAEREASAVRHGSQQQVDTAGHENNLSCRLHSLILDFEEASMSLIKRAGAWCNGEVAYLAWKAQRIEGCLGFMVTRIHETGQILLGRGLYCFTFRGQIVGKIGCGCL